jgi:hypothetical protein
MFAPESQTPRDRRNYRLVGLTQFIWLACLIANGRTFQHLLIAPVRVIVALLPMAAGALVVWTYARFVRQADDLQKAIQLNALAIGFGVCVLFTLGYPPIERLGMPHFEPHHFIGVGLLSYFLASAFSSLRYR